jgi:hypothetical protein
MSAGGWTRASESLDEADATKRDYIGVDTSLGMSRGIPGYPGGLPRGSAGEAGPVPPRPLPLRAPRRRREDVLRWGRDGVWAVHICTEAAAVVTEAEASGFGPAPGG